MYAVRGALRRFSTNFPRNSGGPSVAMKDIDPHWDPKGSGSGRNDGWTRHDPSSHGKVNTATKKSRHLILSLSSKRPSLAEFDLLRGPPRRGCHDHLRLSC
jgi:hypothetical protein